jgi:cytochrome c5
MTKIQMKTTVLISILLVGVMVISIPSCTHDPVGIEGLDTICFGTEVLPILQTSCGMTGCHGNGSAAAGYDLSNYESIIKSVSPRDPRGSKLYKVITSINGENMMPPDRPLTQVQRTIIEVWIAQGAGKTTCPNDTNEGGGGGGGGGTGGTDSICFVQKILPLFISNCAMASCHDGLGQGEEDNLYALNTYASIRQHVTPFNLSASSVYRAVNGQTEEFMPPPPKPALTAAQKDLMKKWIEDGALNSDCPNANCDTTGTISFVSQVKPIIDNYCVSCHNSSTTSGGVNLNGHAQVKAYAESIRNGTPVLIGTIRQIAGFKAMPPSTKLDECSIRKIERWIDQGRLNN